MSMVPMFTPISSRIDPRDLALQVGDLSHDIGSGLAEFIEKVGAQRLLPGFQACQRGQDRFVAHGSRAMMSANICSIRKFLRPSPY